MPRELDNPDFGAYHSRNMAIPFAHLRAAAALGSWLLGHATEFSGADGVESFTPSQLLSLTGAAFASLRSRESHPHFGT